VAVKDVIDTVSELDVNGMLNVVTVGSVASPVAGLLDASPGNVRALISVILVNPSLSESSGSMVAKLCPLLPKALP
jgi:hypothetical protein